jgi:hypothetical protein
LRSTTVEGAARRRHGRRTPFGESIAHLTRERDAIRPPDKPWKRKRRTNPIALCIAILGREFGAHVMFVLMHAVFETAVRARREFGKDRTLPNRRAELAPVTLRQHPVSERNETVRVALALLLMICEQVHVRGDRAGWACNVELWLGQQRRKRGGEWEYVPKDEQGGLAARLGTDVRTIERALAVLQAGRILRAWQPPADEMPDHLRGDVYAYQVYALHELPDCLAYALRRWDDLAASRSRSSKGKPTAAVTKNPGELDRVDFGAVADAGMALYRAAIASRGQGPPAPS